jgi:hypothetical protein
MENYKAVIGKRIRFHTVGISLLSLLSVLHVSELFRPIATTHYFDFITGAQLSTTLVLMIISFVKIAKYRKVLVDERLLTILYNTENDERTQYIQNKSGGMILVVCAFIIFAAALIVGFFNFSAFIALMIVAYFLLIVKKCLQFYYGKKF